MGETVGRGRGRERWGEALHPPRTVGGNWLALSGGGAEGGPAGDREGPQGVRENAGRAGGCSQLLVSDAALGGQASEPAQQRAPGSPRRTALPRQRVSGP